MLFGNGKNVNKRSQCICGCKFGQQPEVEQFINPATAVSLN